MNERIKLLALQAGEYVNSVYTPPIRSKEPGKIWEDGHVDWMEQFNEKFAELIVRECADLYNHEDVLAPIGMSAHGEAHQHGWIEGTKTYRDTILEHFGVAE
jgi:hypothetical protein